MADDLDLSFRLEDYDFELPPELIAQAPAPRRELSRLLVLNRRRNTIEHSRFDSIIDYFDPGDLLVVNDTRVVRARLQGRKDSGGKAEILVLDPYKPPESGAEEGYLCLVRASKGVKPGRTVYLEDGTRAEILAPGPDGTARVRFHGGNLLDILDRIGEVPLPPYIARLPGCSPVDDFSCYQTEYARKPGAVAAPTAGLHFSADLLEGLKAAGVETAAVTLHVGYGTFAPIRCEDIREHRMHSEYFEVSAETAEAVAGAKKDGRRVVAVGTTVVRTLEWVAAGAGGMAPLSGPCDHYIYPGYRFEVVDRMITNFHLPGSSLILLVSAFAGRNKILAAYAEAVREKYRFFSYGDAMLIV
ncbi:MAG: tRNA preQ1(34) S-adenosylmethionine ribosyltransferase-isomerase QueA [Syntrophobacteraceae bacterium]